MKEQLSPSLSENLNRFHSVFQEDSTIKFRQMACGLTKRPVALIFADGMVSDTLVNEHIVESLLTFRGTLPQEGCATYLRRNVLFSDDIVENRLVDDLLYEILSGNTVLLVDGEPCALVLATRGYKMRSIDEPPAEKVLQGPREGFTEVILHNLSMIRRKICNPNLRFRFRTLGVQTHTKTAVAYIEGIADPAIVAEVERRLERIRIDGILDANYVEELIKDSPWSPFKTIGSTERPDIVAAKLLEGRVAIVIDGTPVVLTAPFFFLEYFLSNDDYYNNFYFGTFGRWLRILGFWTTISLPAVFLSLFTMHQDLLPTRFLLNLVIARENLPFPTFLEMLILILGFELIREGGAKAPENFGQTLGIVGGLVLGQAAVDARLVSIPVVIIIAFTGITGLMIPQMKSSVILLRLGFLLLAALWGIPGYLSGLFFLLLYLCSMKSFTIPYTSTLSRDRRAMLQDTVVRSPWFRMIRRPEPLAPSNPTRQSRSRSHTAVCILPFLLLALCSSGCSSREINDANIVSGITVKTDIESGAEPGDEADGGFLICAQIPSATDSTDDARLLCGRGDTFAAAMEDCRKNSDRDLFWNHAKSIALPEDVTLAQLRQVADYVMEHRELRIASDLVLIRAKDGEVAPSYRHLKLQEMLLSEELQSWLPSVKVYQLFHRLSDGNPSVSLPLFIEQDDGSLLPEGTITIE